MTRKKLFLFFGVAIFLCMLPLMASATGNISFTDVKFSKNSEPVYVATAGDIGVATTIKNTGDASDALFIIASFDDSYERKLNDVSYSVISLPSGETTAKTSVNVKSADSVVEVMLWNTGNFSPLTTPRTLSSLSCDKYIKSMAVSLESEGRTTGTIPALIDNDNFKIDFYVPTASNFNFGDAKQNRYTESAVDAKFTAFVPTEYVSGGSCDFTTEKNVLEGDTYTVTAEDGTAVTYDVRVIKTAIAHGYNFDKANIGWPAARDDEVDDNLVYDDNHMNPVTPRRNTTNTSYDRFYLPYSDGSFTNGTWGKTSWDYNANYAYSNDDEESVYRSTHPGSVLSYIRTWVNTYSDGEDSFKALSIKKITAGNAGEVSTTNTTDIDGFANLASANTSVTGFDFMLSSDITAGDGRYVYFQIGNNSNYVQPALVRTATGKYSLYTRPNSAGSLARLSDKMLSLGEWHRLTLVTHVTPVEASYLHKTSFYIDNVFAGEFEQTLSIANDIRKLKWFFFNNSIGELNIKNLLSLYN